MASQIKISATKSKIGIENVYNLKVENIPKEIFEENKKNNSQLIIVLDRSGSMGGNPIIEAKKAMIDIVNQTSENVKITIITFDHASQLYAPKNKDEAVRIINGIRVGGSTSFSSAISCIEQNIDLNKDDINIIFLTDGLDNAYGYYRSENSKTLSDTINDLKTKIIKKNTTVYSLGFGSGHDSRFLAELTNIGNQKGLFQYIRNSSEIESAIEPILGLISDKIYYCKINSLEIPLNQDDEYNIIGKIKSNLDFEDMVPYQININDTIFTGKITFENVELPINEIIDIIGENIRETIGTGILKLKTDPGIIQSITDSIKECEITLEKIKTDAFKLPRIQKKHIMANIQDIFPMINDFYRLTSGINARSMNNETIAKLNEIAYSGQLKRGTQKKLDKRSEVNAEKFSKNETKIEEMISKNSDFSVNPELQDYKDFLTTLNITDTFLGGDCMCLCISMSRSEAAISEPSKVKINDIYPSMMGADSFQESVLHSSPGSMGDFDKCSQNFVIKGEGNNEISGILPLYINETHWQMSKIYMPQVLGLITTLDPLGYQYQQIMTVPFLILQKAKYNLVHHPSEFHKRIYSLIYDTCVAILKDYKEIDDIKDKYHNFKDPANRTIDIIPCLNVFSMHIMILLNMNIIEKDAEFNNFHKYVVEEQHRRFIPNQIDINVVNRLVSETFDIPYKDYYDNELINMRNKQKMKTTESSNGIDVKYTSILYKQYPEFEKELTVQSNKTQITLLEVKEIEGYQLPETFQLPDYNLPKFNWIFGLESPEFTTLEIITMIIQNSYQSKNSERKKAITDDKYYTLDKCKEYLTLKIKELISEKKTQEINNLQAAFDSLESGAGAEFFCSTDNLDAAAGFLCAQRTFGERIGHDIINYIIECESPYPIEKMNMLRNGTYYKEYKYKHPDNGEEITEVKKFIIQYLNKTPGKPIKWDPKKGTCNKFYMKYRELNPEVKFWKKLFKGCHKFGGIFGNEYRFVTE